MTKIFSIEDMKQANGEAALIRKAYDEETWEEFQKCSFAFFPGCKLTASEPELVLKAYDDIKYHNPDTGIFLYCCGIPAKVEGDEVLLEKTISEIKSGWEQLGNPTLIIGCLGCYNTIKSKLPEIPMVTVFKFLKEIGVDRGCNAIDFIFKAPAGSPVADETAAIMKDLAEGMGIKFHEESEESNHPYLVCSIKDRDALKKDGKDAVHIMELIYGMGESNIHLDQITEPDEASEDCSGGCSSCSSCGGCSISAIPALLPDEDQKKQNRLDLKQAMLDFFFNEF